MEAERAGSVSNCQSFLLPFPCTFNLYLTLIPSSPTTPSSSHFLIYKPPFNLQQLSTMHTKSAMFTSLLFLALILLPTIITAAQLPRTSSIKQSGNKCKFPGAMLVRPGFKPVVQRSNGKIVHVLEPQALKEWQDCVGSVGKVWAGKWLRRLRKSFVKLDAFKHVIEMSGCAKKEVLKIFDRKATAEEARNSEKCLKKFYAGEDSSSRENLKGVVRFDAECELQKKDMINEATEQLAVALTAALAASICCAPALGAILPNLVWCALQDVAVQEAKDATAALYAAMAIKCPECSDEGLLVRQVQDKLANEGYRSRFKVYVL